MYSTTLELPEPFRSALERGAPAEVADHPVTTPEGHFARAHARLGVGRDADAWSDFAAAEPALGDLARIELALLDIRHQRDVETAGQRAREIAERATAGGRLAARAWHVVGLAAGKLRATGLATDALLKSRELYRALGNRAAVAQVLDTLGMMEAALGRLDQALHCFALSLVDKTLCGDRPGMAITLGNIGRTHLRAGRYPDAVDCFQRDLEIATQLHDLRGQARMHNDLARAWLGQGDYQAAERSLEACLALGDGPEFSDVRFLAQKDRALLRMAQGRMDDAGEELQRAESQLPPGDEPYYRLLLLSARGQWLAARGDGQAVAMLEAAAHGFAEAELPDLEIDSLLTLARALIAGQETRAAEKCLARGLELARDGGYPRYLAALNEAMAELSLTEPLAEEQDRRFDWGTTPRSGGYVIRERLGGGAFGEVFRAYDPTRARDVALKRLRLGSLYDVKQREWLIASAKTELLAASRIRHPGVVRVLSLGTEPSGAVYVAQEFVPGRSLRSIMPDDASADVNLVTACLERIADSLVALHGAGVVHRDLKPENVLLREDGSPVLVDFGVAHLPDAARQAGGMTGVGDDSLIVGTLPYMAPEQAAGKDVDGRADLYSLGVIAFEWLAGIRPIRPQSTRFVEVVEEITTRVPPSLADFRPRLSPELVELVAALLAKKPKQRPASAEAVAEELRRLRAAGPLEGEAPSDEAELSTIAIGDRGHTPGNRDRTRA